MPRFSLKTLLIAAAVMPPIIYFAYWVVTETEWLVNLYSVARK